jgi:predicted amidohydrolase
MKTNFIQFSPEFGETDANVDKALSMMEKADSELIVLSELFNTGYFFISQQEVCHEVDRDLSSWLCYLG